MMILIDVIGIMKKKNGLMSKIYKLIEEDIDAFLKKKYKEGILK